MVRFELSVDIARSVHEVWEYLIDPENVPEWQGSAESSHQISDGPMGVGTHLVEPISWTSGVSSVDAPGRRSR